MSASGGSTLSSLAASGGSDVDEVVTATSVPSAPSPATDTSNGNALSSWDGRRLAMERHPSDSWYEQAEIEARVKSIRDAHGYESANKHALPRLQRERHVSWLLRNLRRVTHGYGAYDALQPWVAYWITHSLNVLNEPIPSDDAQALVELLRSMRVNDGAHSESENDNGNENENEQQQKVDSFVGGPGQCVGHVASTFAAVMALISLGTREALETVCEMRGGLLAFVRRRYDASLGSFEVSQYGERDVRALYCALAVASVVSDSEEWWWYKSEDIARYLRSLLAFDGGLAGECGAEAHGGNTYCGLAAAKLAGVEWSESERASLIDWMVMRQMPYEGGFQGRVNKLVDSCYSFWLGASFPLIAAATEEGKDEGEGEDKGGYEYCTWDTNALRAYVLQCCQLDNGGLRDKPGTPRDLMHTCYALSGLSVSIHYGDCKKWEGDGEGEGEVGEREQIEKVNVVYNLREDRLAMAKMYFERSYRDRKRDH